MNIIIIILSIIVVSISISMSITSIGGVLYTVKDTKSQQKIETTSSNKQESVTTTNDTFASDTAKQEIYNKRLESYKRDLQIWEEAKQKREEYQKKWDERRDTRMKSKESDIEQKGECEPWHKIPDSGDCGDGWEIAKKEVCMLGWARKICKKSESLRRREAEQEEGARPEDYNAPKPVEPSSP